MELFVLLILVIASFAVIGSAASRALQSAAMFARIIALVVIVIAVAR